MPDKESKYPRIAVKRKTGNERFVNSGRETRIALSEFWQWAASDLVSNAMRGILAEYIVANALGIAHGVRTEWDAYDLLTPDNIRVEVKSAAYIQSWRHDSLSKIIFNIPRTRGWDAATNVTSTELKRHADIYVFCLLSHQNQNTLDPLDLDQWDFYGLSSEVLERKCPTQKTIGLRSLLKLEPFRCKYKDLAEHIHNLVPR